MQKHIEFTYNGKTLRGMMHIPDGAQGKVPMVAIFHGFTGNKMEPHFVFVKLSRQLEKAGIGSIRFDFYGSGESDGDFSEMTFSGELEDARQIIKFIKNEPMADVENIGILGLSMGGAVAGVIASELKEEIKALALWAPAFNMPELILEQSKSADEKMLGMLEREGIIDIGGLALSKEFIDDLIKLNIFEFSKGYDKPVLIVHGTEDAAVKYEVSDKILEEVYRGNAKRITIEGADHTFNKLEWEKKAIEESINFFKENLKG